MSIGAAVGGYYERGLVVYPYEGTVAHRATIPDATGRGYLTSTLTVLGLLPHEISVDLSDMAREFYGDMACSIVTGRPDKFLEYARYYAEVIVKALYLSCVGEFRYKVHDYAHVLLARYTGDGPLLDETRFGELVRRMSGGTPLDMRGKSRTYVGDNIACTVPYRLAYPAGRASLAADFRIMRSGFVRTGGGGGVGGYPWAYGSELGAMYVSGKLTPTAFVDAVFDQVHNGAPILNKVWGTGWLEPYLDFRRAAEVNTLVLWALPDTWEKYGLERRAFALPSQLLASAAALGHEGAEELWETAEKHNAGYTVVCPVVSAKTQQDKARLNKVKKMYRAHYSGWRSMPLVRLSRYCEGKACQFN